MLSFLWQQISNRVNSISIEPAGHHCSLWGEGPLWWEGALYYVDIEGKRVVKFDPASGTEKSWETGERVGTVVPRENGGLVIAGDRGFSFLDERKGALTRIADPEPNMPNNRFNDGKCSPDGFFFAGTISLVKKTGTAKLYRLAPDRQVKEAYGPVTNSNGIAWSPDGGTLYYIDTPEKEILAFDYKNGKMTNPARVVATSSSSAGEFSPDGMAVDAAGGLWVAFCHGACVLRFDPRSGKETHRVELPCLETTAVAFGGDDLKDLYVTTGVHKTKKEELAGRLLVVRGLGMRGLKAHAFAG